MASYFQSVGCKFCNRFVFYSHGLASEGVPLHIKCNGRCFPVGVFEREDCDVQTAAEAGIQGRDT